MSGCPKNSSVGLSAKTDFLFWSERDEIRRVIFDRDPPLCVWCHARLGDHRSARYYQADHIEPRSAGGAYEQDNLCLSCKPCNTERGSKSILQFLVSRVAA
jgi:5-methylcytosine-specific restriction endonuclease McrA